MRRESGDITLEMHPDEMRRFGYRVVDSIVEHASELREKRVVNVASREQMERLFREDAPESGLPLDELIRVFERDVAPWMSHVDHPRTFAWIPGAGTFVGAMGDALAAGYDIYAGTWVEAAAASQLELVVTDWFRSWLSLPDDAGGTLVSGGSIANLTALVLAREARLGGGLERGVIYTSELGHSSVERGAIIAGLRASQVRKIPVTNRLAIDVGALVEAIERDSRAGRAPFCVVANAGATTTGTVDPLAELADVCESRGLWYHVDAAYGGFAVLDPRGADALKGIERADSVTLDPHKWFYTPFDVGCILVRDFAALYDNFHIMPDYLVDTVVGGREHPNFCDYGIQLSRSTRALKIWMTVKHFGMERIRAVISRTLDLAREAERRFREIRGIEIVSPVSLGIFTFRFVPPGEKDEAEIERASKELLRRIWESGRAMLSSSRVNGRYVIRFCVINHNTTSSDVEETIDLVAEILRQL